MPDARLRNVGLFLQAQWQAGEGTEIVAGGRYQDVRSRSFATEGNDTDPVSYDESTLVGSLNLLQRINDRVNVIASVGRGSSMSRCAARTGYGVTSTCSRNATAAQR